MKRKILCLTLCFSWLLIGCEQTHTALPENRLSESVPLTELQSETTPENCHICGNQENDLMPHYVLRDSIGIIHWNTLSISDTEVRAYDDYGNELFQQEHSGTRFNSFGNGGGSILIQGTPNRGFTNITVHYTREDQIDLDASKEILCQKCLDQVVHFYNDQNSRESEHAGTTGYCLVDFQTRELYTLSDPYRGYFIRDYYVTYELIDSDDGNHIELMIFYAPERTE